MLPGCLDHGATSAVPFERGLFPSLCVWLRTLVALPLPANFLLGLTTACSAPVHLARTDLRTQLSVLALNLSELISLQSDSNSAHQTDLSTPHADLNVTLWNMLNSMGAVAVCKFSLAPAH